MNKCTVNRKGYILRDGQDTGYRLRRGSYQGTCDDRLNGWYIDHKDDNLLDRRGGGYWTKADALAEVYRWEAPQDDRA